MVEAYAAAVLALRPVGYWRCGEPSGSLADSTGNGNTMTAAGVPVYGAAGAITGDGNTAITLPGTDASYFSAAYAASIDTADTFTALGWLKKAADGTLMSILDSHAGVAGYQIRITAANQLELVWKDTSIIVASTATITGTSWHMFAVTKNGTTTKLYIDGADVTGTVTNQTIAATGLGLLIGKYDAGTGRGWNGSFDEIALFDRALTSAEIAALYALGTAPSAGPVTTSAVWREPEPPFSALFSTELGASLVKFEVRAMGTASFLVPRSDDNAAKAAALLARCVPMVTLERSDGVLPFVGFPVSPRFRSSDTSAAIQLADHTLRLSKGLTQIAEEIHAASGTLILDELAAMDARSAPRLYLDLRYVVAGPPASLARSAQGGDAFLRELEKQTGYEAFLTHRVTPGKVETFLRWEERQGADRRLERWDEGVHLADIGYGFDNTKGDNAATTVGGTGALTGRPSATVSGGAASFIGQRSETIALKSGGLGGSRIDFVQGITDPQVLATRSKTVLLSPANAVVRWEGELVESKIDMTRLQVGDIHTIHSDTAFFGQPVQGVARIIGLELDGATGVHRFAAVEVE